MSGDTIINYSGNVVSKSRNVSISLAACSISPAEWGRMEQELLHFMENNSEYKKSAVIKTMSDDALCAIKSKDENKLREAFRKAGAYAIEIICKVSGSALGAFAAATLK